MEISSLHSQEGQNFAAQNDPESSLKILEKQEKKKKRFQKLKAVTGNEIQNPFNLITKPSPPQGPVGSGDENIEKAKRTLKTSSQFPVLSFLSAKIQLVTLMANDSEQGLMTVTDVL